MDLDLRKANEELRREIDNLRNANEYLKRDIEGMTRVLIEAHHEKIDAAPKLIRYHDADEYEVEIKPESTRFSIIWGGELQDASFPAETMNLGSLRDRYNTIADVMTGGHDDEG